MRFGILGPLAVWDENGRELRVGGVKRRALLALLLTRTNRLVPTETIVDELWGERPPATAVKAVQVLVSQLRKILGGGMLQTRPSGYLLEVERSALDAFRFEELLERARRLRTEGDVGAAAAALREGLALWRGPPLADLREEHFARNEGGRLEELRRAALVDCAEAELEQGRPAEAVAELEALVREQPLWERPRELLMLALYRAGRQADALAVYREGRRRLHDELGLDPGQALQDLELAILQHDDVKLERVAQPVAPAPAPALSPPPAPTRACPSCGERTHPGAEFCQRCGERLRGVTLPARKLVTVLLCDVVAGARERLDPEALQLLLSRHFEQATAAVERYGGTAEKLAGDEFMAVFGVPAVREDDALRAVQAAAAVLESTASLRAGAPDGLEVGVRIGINTGEVVVAGNPIAGPGLVTGDAVSVCKRLVHAAEPGEILLGEDTYELVAHAVAGSQLTTSGTNGRPRAEVAFRLGSVDPEAPAIARRDDAPLVGRERELGRLRDLFSKIGTDDGGRLVLVLGEPGIGKSRLAREFLAELRGHATTLIGRCPPYGEGVTFWPMREVLQQAGRGPDALEGSSHDVFAAVRRILEELAGNGPLVVVLDDVQWAEPTLLDLIEYLAARLAAAPVLLVCLARRQLREKQQAWLQDAVELRLGPLSPAESELLLEALGAPPPARGRIAATAEGNPLFVEQLAAIATEDDPGLAMPRSIRAVLHARLDRLSPGERAALECAAVAGRSFPLEAVLDLSAAEARETAGACLLALVRNGFIRPEAAEFEEGFRFQHALIREATYDGIPKTRRADLHVRMAERPEAGASAALGGHHLEQAYKLRGDLGIRDGALGIRAGRLLRAAGEEAFGRANLPAAISFFRRALPLLPPDEAAALFPDLGQALFEAGELAEADKVLAEALEKAGGDPALDARGRVEQQFVHLQADPVAATGHAEDVATAALRVFAGSPDGRGQCRALYLQATVAWNRGRTGQADRLWQRAAGHARDAGDERELFEILGWRASAALFGTTPVSEAIRRCDEILEQVGGSEVAVAVIGHTLAALRAMEGDVAEARRLVVEANVVLAGLARLHSAVSHQEAMVEMLAGKPGNAEAILRAGYERLDKMGEKAVLATTAALLARAVYAQGREREAESLCSFAERTAAKEDIASQVTWRGVRAMIAAKAGRAEEAELLAQEAVARVAGTDMLNRHAEALLDLAETYRFADRHAAAAAAALAAVELFDRKGNAVLAERTRRSFTVPPIPRG